MRDPARIPLLLTALRAQWELEPDMRLGQLLLNVITAKVGGARDPTLEEIFYMEDDALLAQLEQNQPVRAEFREAAGVGIRATLSKDSHG